MGSLFDEVGDRGVCEDSYCYEGGTTVVRVELLLLGWNCSWGGDVAAFGL